MRQTEPRASLRIGGSSPWVSSRPGQRADLILLDADPRVESIRRDRIVGLMGRGRWYSAACFDAELDAIAQSHGN